MPKIETNINISHGRYPMIQSQDEVHSKESSSEYDTCVVYVTQMKPLTM
jgi:hypothetical protein